MNGSVIPQTYDEWRHCITVECGLELSADYVAQRIYALQDEDDHYTQQFIKLYGHQYLQQVLGWFLQCQKNS